LLALLGAHHILHVSKIRVNSILARHVMIVYSDVEIELHAFVVPAANGSGQPQASVAGCTYRLGGQLVVDGWM
jgi:hypothetical protein